jgi:L-aminopeptidase/D-esterase-like protein
MAHGALSRAIRPVHTPMDGDIVVALSTGLSGRQGNLMQAAALGARALEKAILDAVRSATGTKALPSAKELPGKGGKRHD